MTPERWRQVERIYHQAASRPPVERASFLDQACAGDADLRKEVERMLDGEAEAAGFLEAPTVEVAARALAANAARISPGSRLGPYEIVSLVGAGGMGEVYKARDTRLNRTVAIKVLPPLAADDAERRKRFLREARAASALNHPNIVTLHDVVSEDGRDSIVMEYVEGKTLAERIGRKGLPLAEALRYAIQIADALAAAHAAGIVHRDVKPGNIMVTETSGPGTVKVLDFGLAKLWQRQGLEDETASMTAQGTIAGTVAYMSPEQAEGKPVDARSDIFSFGSVLYEMVTGRQAFHGDTAVSTVTAILRIEPRPVREFNASVPPEMERILARCLRKDPARRFQTMSDLKVSLEDLRDEPEPPLAGAPVRRRALYWAWLAFAALGILAGGLAAALWMKPKPIGSTAASILRITSDPGLNETPAISPDGKLVAFASDRSGEGDLDIWVRQVSGGEPIRITHNPAHDLEPRFSPDSSHIAFHSGREGGGIYLVSALGGEERLLVRGGSAPRFSPDGQWLSYFAGGEGGLTGHRFINVISTSGGQPISIRSNLAGLLAGIWAPDSRSLLLSGTDYRSGVYEACIVEVQTGATKCLDAATTFRELGLSSPVFHDWVGEYVYLTARSGDASSLWRIRLSQTDRRLSRAAERLTTGIGQESDPSVAIQPDGTSLIAFSVQTENRDVWVLPLGPGGAASGSGARVTSDLLADQWPSASGDGRWMAYVSGPSIRLKDLQHGEDRLLLERGVSPNQDGSMALSPDGSRLAFRLGGSVVGLSLPDTARETLLEVGLRPESWSRDKRWLLLMNLVSDNNALILLDLESKQRTPILSSLGWGLHSGRFSPDERWVSFHATTSPTTRRIFVAPFRGAEAIPQDAWIPITDGRGMDREPRWSPDGKLIYFLSDRDGFRCVWAQPVDLTRRAVRGSPFPVYHAHSARITLDLGADTGPNGLAIAPGKMIVTMAENTGNIWLATFR